MYLHENRDDFEDFIHIFKDTISMSDFTIEKDYYVTMILRLLSQKFPSVVFKGGTSLSKCHKVIKRFSEDIGIAVNTPLSDGEKRESHRFTTSILCQFE